MGCELWSRCDITPPQHTRYLIEMFIYGTISYINRQNTIPKVSIVRYNNMTMGLYVR